MLQVLPFNEKYWPVALISSGAFDWGQLEAGTRRGSPRQIREQADGEQARCSLVNVFGPQLKGFLYLALFTVLWGNIWPYQLVPYLGTPTHTSEI